MKNTQLKRIISLILATVVMAAMMLTASAVNSDEISELVGELLTNDNSVSAVGDTCYMELDLRQKDEYSGYVRGKEVKIRGTCQSNSNHGVYYSAHRVEDGEYVSKFTSPLVAPGTSLSWLASGSYSNSAKWKLRINVYSLFRSSEATGRITVTA